MCVCVPAPRTFALASFFRRATISAHLSLLGMSAPFHRSYSSASTFSSPITLSMRRTCSSSRRRSWMRGEGREEIAMNRRTKKPKGKGRGQFHRTTPPFSPHLAVAAEHGRLKVGLHERNGALDGGKGRLGDRHLARHGVAAADNLQVLCHGAAAVLGQRARTLVAHPAVNTTATRVHPEQLLEAKVLWRGRGA